MMAESFLALLSPEFSKNLWYVPAATLGLLAVSAIEDARSGRVPTSLILLCLAQTLFISALYEGWALAGTRFALAATAFWILKSVNALYFLMTNRDGFGLGDAKWTAAAAATFGLPAVLWAWIFGAWFGLVWMAARFVVGLIAPRMRGRGYIHFAPFLTVGLVVKLYAEDAFMRFLLSLFG